MVFFWSTWLWHWTHSVFPDKRVSQSCLHHTLHTVPDISKPLQRRRRHNFMAVTNILPLRGEIWHCYGTMGNPCDECCRCRTHWGFCANTKELIQCAHGGGIQTNFEASFGSTSRLFCMLESACFEVVDDRTCSTKLYIGMWDRKSSTQQTRQKLESCSAFCGRTLSF